MESEEAIPETIVSKVHDMVWAAGGRYEDWSVGVRGQGSVGRPGAALRERAASPAVARIIVDHFARLGANPERAGHVDADEVFVEYQPKMKVPVAPAERGPSRQAITFQIGMKGVGSPVV